MTERQDGGQAFPMIEWRSPDGMVGMNVQSGMSLRDWFAGQALIGAALAINDGLIDPSHEGVARMAYKYADAMLAERARTGGTP